MLNKGHGITEVGRFLGLDPWTIRSIRKESHSYDRCVTAPVAPIVSASIHKNKPPPRTPEHVEFLRNTLTLAFTKEENASLTIEELSLCRRYGLLDESGTIIPHTVLPHTHPYWTTPSSNGTGISSPKKVGYEEHTEPTIPDLLNPSYYDNVLDEEVASYERAKSKDPVEPVLPAPRDKIPAHLVPLYGRCHSCGGWVAKPCWKCYIESVHGEGWTDDTFVPDRKP